MEGEMNKRRVLHLYVIISDSWTRGDYNFLRLQSEQENLHSTVSPGIGVSSSK